MPTEAIHYLNKELVLLHQLPVTPERLGKSFGCNWLWVCR